MDSFIREAKENLRLIRNDIETLLYAICDYENGQSSKVDAALIENIAAKYGYEFVEIQGLTRTTLSIQCKE